jgi:hypothetical protein
VADSSSDSRRLAYVSLNERPGLHGAREKLHVGGRLAILWVYRLGISESSIHLLAQRLCYW